MGTKAKNTSTPEAIKDEAAEQAKAAEEANANAAEETTSEGTGEVAAAGTDVQESAAGTDEGTDSQEGASDDAAAGTDEGATIGVGKAPETSPEVQQAQPTPVKPQPHHIAFFEQFVELTKAKRADQAIKAFNNSLKSMFDVGTNDAFNNVYKLFKESGDTLTTTTALQSAAILPHSDRAVVEVVFTIFHILKTNQKDASVNLDLVRTLTKSEKFVVWCTKKLQK